MSNFVEECRREWKRLDVPDPIANEMAADLAADLDEAEAEGVAREEVLGNAAFDPRAFAASWARERGVAGPPPREKRRRWLVVTLVVVAAVFTLLLTVGAAVALAMVGSSASQTPSVTRLAPIPARRATVRIPLLVGQRLSVATLRLASAGLAGRVRYERTATADAGTVTAQSPAPGAAAVTGAAVVLVVRR